MDAYFLTHRATVCSMLSATACLMAAFVASRSVAQAPADAIRFQYMAMSPRDVVLTSSHVVVDASISFVQNGLTVANTPQKLDRHRSRRLELLGSKAPDERRAEIVYAGATEAITDAIGAHEAKAQSINGKTYRVTRRGEELLIEDSTGRALGKDEEKLLRDDLEWFGRTNPLAKLLADRTVQVGETLQLPPEVAKELMGIRPEEGTARCEITLLSIDRQDGAKAHFAAQLKGTARGETAHTIDARGRITIDALRCRTTSVEMRGDIQQTVAKGEGDSAFKQVTRGVVSVSLLGMSETAQR